MKGVKLAFDLSRDYFLYVQRMMEIKTFENFIPTISIKKGFILGHTDLEKLILDLKISNNPSAVRITDDVFDNYSSFLTILLDSNDYILLDLREQNIDARFMELTEFQNMKTAAKKILLNSPRLRELSNGEYEHLQFTDKIDNSCVEKYQAYNLDGFGDFGGLKDTLPRDGAPHGCA